MGNYRTTPPQLFYASVNWANYLEVANIEDADLTNGLEMFVDEHMLHWCEFPDLIGELDSVHSTLCYSGSQTSEVRPRTCISSYQTPYV